MATIDSPLADALHGRYELERELGRGGMATVYLAEDTRHHRRVAIKVLHPELSAVLGLERFLKEIELTANLQHPHILPLFDSGEAEGLLYYVMPYVEGESLRSRLVRERQLPIAEAVRIATDVADALAYAHRHGVIHRDIKPENILVHDGRPVVADFGIALAVQQAGGERMTQTGLSLGTPQYMAPEQATGERGVDLRADVYSLGAVTYEMLAGEPPFTGPTAQAVVARMLTEEPPPLARRRRSVPEHVEAAVLTALEKLPADRFASATDFAAALTGAGALRRRERAALRWNARRLVLAGAGGVLLLVAALWAATRPPRETAPVRVARVDVILPDSTPMGFIGAAALGAGRRAFAISRDARVLVYAGVQGGISRLYVRPLDSWDIRPLAGTEGAYGPFFSPNGRWVGFFVGNELRKIRVEGGAPVRIAEATNPAGASWGADGRIVFVTREGRRLLRVAEDGGAVELLGDGPEYYRWPFLLPDGKSLLISPGGSLRVIDLETRRGTSLPIQGSDARYAAGHLLFSRGSTVFAARFDPASHHVLGPAVPVLAGVRTEVYYASQWDVGENGTLVYAPGHSVAENPLVWVGRDGSRERLPLPARLRGSMEVSPNGRYLAVVEFAGTGSDLWVYDLRDLRAQRLTTIGTVRHPLFWSSDGKRIVYTLSATDSGFAESYVQALDGGAAERLLPAGDTLFASSWSADGRLLGASSNSRPSAARGVFVIERVSGERRPVRISPSDMWGTAISPDGRLVAYTSDEIGDFQNLVEPIPPTGVRRPVSRTGGAEEPRWSPDGRRLFYRSGQRILEIPVSTSPELTLGEPRVVFEGDFVNVSGRSYALAPDGRRVLVIEGGVGETRQLRIVQGWLTEVARLTRDAEDERATP